MVPVVGASTFYIDRNGRRVRLDCILLTVRENSFILLIKHKIYRAISLCFFQSCNDLYIPTKVLDVVMAGHCKYSQYENVTDLKGSRKSVYCVRCTPTRRKRVEKDKQKDEEREKIIRNYG